MTLNKKQYREILEDVCSEYCQPEHYCILKEFLVSSHTSPRLLMQLKCIDKFKYEESKSEDKDIGWADAMKQWIEKGYAKKFGEIYDEDLSFLALYKKVMN